MCVDRLLVTRSHAMNIAPWLYMYTVMGVCEIITQTIIILAGGLA